MLALAVFSCGDRGQAVHPKLSTGLLQVLPEHAKQPRNIYIRVYIYSYEEKLQLKFEIHKIIMVNYGKLYVFNLL
jgi:hypothetical protein